MHGCRWIASLLAGIAAASAGGCCFPVGGRSQPPPPIGAPPPRPQSPGMSTQNKVLLVAGAAAVYYLYKKHQNAKGTGPQGQYYRSKNGRIYYRDAKGNPVWVTPPTQPIQVDADEYARLTGQRIQNY